MKVSELEVGQKYRTRKGRTVIVVATGFEKNGYGGIRRAKDGTAGTHVAVARAGFSSGTQYWYPDHAAAFEIERVAPTDAEIAAGNLKAQHDRELAKARADALQSRVDVAIADIRTLLDLNENKYIAATGGNVTLTIENLEALLELAKAGAA